MHRIEIKYYHEDMREEFELFRIQSLLEGNESLALEKFNQDNFDGKIWCLFVDDEMACVSAAERDR